MKFIIGGILLCLFVGFICQANNIEIKQIDIPPLDFDVNNQTQLYCFLNDTMSTFKTESLYTMNKLDPFCNFIKAFPLCKWDEQFFRWYYMERFLYMLVKLQINLNEDEWAEQMSKLNNEILSIFKLYKNPSMCHEVLKI